MLPYNGHVSAQSTTFVVTLLLPGGEQTIQVRSDEHIWDAALAAGIKLPALCHQGRCLTCAGRLLNGGEVDQSDSASYYPQAGYPPAGYPQEPNYQPAPGSVGVQPGQPNTGGVSFDNIAMNWYVRPGDNPLVSTRGHYADHIALSVADLDAWYAKLKSEGVKILIEPYKVGDSRAFMVEGPSKEALELVEVK